MTIDGAVAELLRMAAELGGNAELFVRKFDRYTGEAENRPVQVVDLYVYQAYAGEPRQAVIDVTDL